MLAEMLYDSGYSEPGEDLCVMENSSDLIDRLLLLAGAQLFTLIDFQTVFPVLGLWYLNVNWMVGYHTLQKGGKL